MQRLATLDDIPALLEIGERFADYSPLGVPFCPERTKATLEALITSDEGFVMVCGEQEVQGVIVAALAPIWYSSAVIAAEMALWIDPSWRGGHKALRLVKKFQAWAKEKGATGASLSDLREGGRFRGGMLYKRLGYRCVERSHYKEV